MRPFGERASSHPGGLIDLSIGTPVDPTPQLIQAALAASANSPGYPLTAGSLELRAAITEWVIRVLGAAPGFGVLPTIGSKELVAWLPSLLGLGSDDPVVIPKLAYPTYDVGARLAGCRVVIADDPNEAGTVRPSVVWLNSPANPTGRVLTCEQMAHMVAWARDQGALVVSDECYFELPWTQQPVSVLNPDVCGGDPTGVLAVHSLSKRSNLAGYRFGFVAGDPNVVARLLEVRKHAGMMVPNPVQAAAIAALGDDEHVRVQRLVYKQRRDLLKTALTDSGFRIDHSQAGLYLWATRGESCWDTVAWLANRGILVTPGEFYGAAGTNHVRMALTAPTERVSQLGPRLAG